MLTIHLKPDLAEQITSLVGEEQTSAEAFVEKALRTYLTQVRQEKIRVETKAFRQQYDELLTKYRGQYVALHKGQVIDHDPDLRTLHLRVFDQLGHIPVLLKQVTEKPDRELIFRSPHFEQGQQ